MASVGMRRLLAGLVLAATGAALSSATPVYWDEFKRTYAIKPGTAIDATSCGVCHTSPPKRNSFGATVDNAFRAAGSKKLTAALLASVEGQDPDKDGFTSGREIRADTLPGDASSKPNGEPDVPAAEAPASDGTDATEASGTGASTPLGAPDHAFHPAIVHFPIALFLFGTVLELIGIARKSKEFRMAGWWNLLAGSVTSVAAMVTGLAAMNWQSRTADAATQLHQILGIAATVLMLATCVVRRKSAPESPLYIAWLLLVAALVSAAGHFGAVLVHG